MSAHRKTREEWRCPNMSRHFGLRGAPLATPCPDCYSVEVVEVRVPFILATVLAHRSFIVLDKTQGDTPKPSQDTTDPAVAIWSQAFPIGA